ncbi:MAG: CAP domain-containing protein, partial [Acidobacteria bacterium]
MRDSCFSRREFLCATATIAAGARLTARRQERDPGDLSWHVYFLTNQQRGWRRIPHLQWAEELAELARDHSKDMLARRFFDHRNPDGMGPVERTARRGVQLAVSENLYWIRGGPEDQAQLASIVVQ